MPPKILQNVTYNFGEYSSFHLFATTEIIQAVNQFIALNYGGTLQLTKEQEAQAENEVDDLKGLW